MSLYFVFLSSGNRYISVKSHHGRISIEGINTEALEAVYAKIGEEDTQYLIDRMIDNPSYLNDIAGTIMALYAAPPDAEPLQVITDWLGDMPDAGEYAEYLFKEMTQNGAILMDALEAIEEAIPGIPPNLLPVESSIAMNNYFPGQMGTIQIFAPALEIGVNSLDPFRENAIAPFLNRMMETQPLSTGSISAITDNQGGNAGNIQINVRDISLKNYGFIKATTANSSHAGNITIGGFNQTIADRISVTDRSSIIASSDNVFFQFYKGDPVYLESGDAGNININTHHLVLENGGFINSFSYYGTGKAGTIDIETDTALFTGEGSGIAVPA